MSKWHAELMREMIRISSMLFEGEENKEEKVIRTVFVKLKSTRGGGGGRRRRGEYRGRGRRDGEGEGRGRR